MLALSDNYFFSGLKAFFDVILDTLTYSPTTTILSLAIVLLALYSFTTFNCH